MAYRRKLTALFISAAFVLTLALSFFFIAKELLCFALRVPSPPIIQSASDFNK